MPHAGEIVALMGLSGSGKTTILRVDRRPRNIRCGEIASIVRLQARTSPRVARRLHQHVGMVFQFHYLFDHLSALDNVALAPVSRATMPVRQAAARAPARLLDQLGVGHRAAALPRELSGGEAQRVAIARALAVDPPLLLAR